VEVPRSPSRSASAFSLVVCSYLSPSEGLKCHPRGSGAHPCKHPSTHGQGPERLARPATTVRASAAYPGELLQAGGSRADSGNGALEPVAVSIGPQDGTVGPFRPLGATGTRWSALLAWESGTAMCVAGPEGKCRA
jgi:hypothetical protein